MPRMNGRHPKADSARTLEADAETPPRIFGLDLNLHAFFIATLVVEFLEGFEWQHQRCFSACFVAKLVIQRRHVRNGTKRRVLNAWS